MPGNEWHLTRGLWDHPCTCTLYPFSDLWLLSTFPTLHSAMNCFVTYSLV